MEPRAPRMVELFVKYSKCSEEVFLYDGLAGSVVYGKTNIPDEAYSHPVVKILDGGTLVLEIHREKEYAPRTKAYIESYSDRLDLYMDALERTTSELKRADQIRVDENNKRWKEIRVYENNLF